MPGTTEMLIIFGVVVLLFGASKLPKLGGAIGESIRNFKKGIASSDEEDIKISQKNKSSQSDVHGSTKNA